MITEQKYKEGDKVKVVAYHKFGANGTGHNIGVTGKIINVELSNHDLYWYDVLEDEGFSKLPISLSHIAEELELCE